MSAHARRLGELPPASWYDTDRPFRSDVTAGRLLAEAAAAHAEQPAVIAGPPGRARVAWTYAELHADALRTARLLQRLGLGPTDHVGIVGHHDPSTVLAVHAALLAGVTFVPVDPRWPAARRATVLQAVAASTVLGRASDVGWLAEVAGVAHVVTPTEDRHDAWRARTAELWDAVSAAASPVEAAGFNLGGGGVDEAEVARYAAHAAALATEGGASAVLEIGFGSGLVLRELAARVDLVSGVEPAPGAVRRAVAWADEAGVFADLVTGFADEVDTLAPGPHDAVLLASAIQYFPGLDYLRATLDAVARVVRPGGRAVVVDVIPPGRAPVAGLLEVDERWFAELAGDVWGDVEIRHRSAEQGWSAVLRDRYDVILHRSAGEPPAPTGDAGAPGAVPRVWTSWDVAEMAADPVPESARPDDTAYVIFTSGSTGQPKGVRIAHRSLVNLVEWMAVDYPLAPGDMALQVVSHCFDLAVYDVAGVLTTGAALRVVDDECLSEPAEIARVLTDERVTFWNSAPAALLWVLPFLRDADAALRLVFLSGDWIPVTMPDEIRRLAPGARIVSLGGATEATVWSNHYPIDEVDPSWRSIPYGWPMPNARYYLLDDERREVPIGEVGEIYIAGTCVAQGYHDDPVRTAAAFLPDPRRAGDVMYRTGDNARWRPDGVIELLGRIDTQVKIRGHRVELEEIESVICRMPGVDAATVVAAPAAGDRLLAAFVVAPPEQVPSEEVAAACRQTLPDYMVPKLVQHVARLPLTANGKVDRALLTERAGAAFEGTP